MTDINTSATTSAVGNLTTDYALVSVSGAVRRMSFALLGRCIGFLQGGTGAQTRTMEDKLREAHVSVMDFGATRGTTGAPTTASDTAFTNALTYLVSTGAYTNRLNVPIGYFRLSGLLDLPPNIEVLGCGKQNTHVYMYTTATTNGGAITQGRTTSNATGAIDLAATSTYSMRDIHIYYAGSSTDTTLHGVRITHTSLWDSVYVQNFPGHGLYFDTYNATATDPTQFGPDNSRFTDCWFNFNYCGVQIRYAASGCIFFNCQMTNNATYGFRHLADGGRCTGNMTIAGQASYNKSYGYYLQSGSDFQMYGTYAEYNQAASGSDTAYTNSTVTTYGNDPGDFGTGLNYDFYVGNTLTNSWINIGTLLGNTDAARNQKVRTPGGGAGWGTGTSTSTNWGNVQLWEGGRQGWGVT